MIASPEVALTSKKHPVTEFIMAARIDTMVDGDLIDAITNYCVLHDKVYVLLAESTTWIKLAE